MINPHPQDSFWHRAAEIFGAPDIKYCEETIAHFISEPANTWSNSVLIAVGVYLHLKHKKTGRLIDFYGASVAIMGLLSFTYHLSNNFLSQFFDFLGMYGAVALLMFINLKRLHVLSEKKIQKNFPFSFIPFSLLVLLMRYLTIPIQKSISLVIAFVLGSEVFIYLKKRAYVKSYKALLWGLVMVIIAGAFQLIDVNRLYCDPHNHIIQPHALWHVFNGIAFYFFYSYFLSVEDSGTEVA